MAKDKEFTPSAAQKNAHQFGHHNAHIISLWKASHNDTPIIMVKIELDKAKQIEHSIIPIRDTNLLSEFWPWTDPLLDESSEASPFVFPESDQPICSVQLSGTKKGYWDISPDTVKADLVKRAGIVSATLGERGIASSAFNTALYRSKVREFPTTADALTWALETFVKPTPSIPARTLDDIRHDIEKIIGQYGVPMATAIGWIGPLTPALEADPVAAQFYLDDLTKRCIQHSNGGATMTTEQAVFLLNGNAKHKRLSDEPENKEISPMAAADSDDIDVALGRKTATDEFNAAMGSSNELSNLAASGAALTEPSAGEQAVADVEAIKAAKEADVIEGEIVDESTEPITPAKSTGEKVADKLTSAFPDASKEWKVDFFTQVTGCSAVAKALNMFSESALLGLLDKEIESTKSAIDLRNLPVSENAPTTNEKAEISNAAPTTPKIENGSIAPSFETPIVDTGEQSTKALSIVHESGLASVSQSLAFKWPTHQQFEELKEVATVIAKSRFYKGIDTTEKAFVVALQAFTLDINPFTAFQGIFVIPDREGNLSLMYGAVLLKALVDKSKLCKRFDINSSETQCTVTVQRHDREKWSVYTYTLEQARTAGLLGKKNWISNPTSMLMHRAVAIAAKAECPEIIYSFTGVLAIDEADAA